MRRVYLTDEEMARLLDSHLFDCGIMDMFGVHVSEIKFNDNGNASLVIDWNGEKYIFPAQYSYLVIDGIADYIGGGFTSYHSRLFYDGEPVIRIIPNDQEVIVEV